jgi:TRAP-type C4-dicarboxylate transport system permease small subunit
MSDKSQVDTISAGLIDTAFKVARLLATWLSYLAVGLLLLMMLLTCFNVVVRSIPGGFALIGIYEITGYLASAVVAFAIAYTQLSAGHIAIDWVVTRLSGRAQAVVRSLTLLLSAGLFVLLAWQSYLFAGDLWLKGEVSPTQKMPFFPFVYVVAVGCVPVALLLLVDFVKSVARVVRK